VPRLTTRSDLRTPLPWLPFDAFRALSCFAIVLLVACSGGGNAAGDEPGPQIQTVNLAVAGQTVTKVRAAGGVVALLEERLTSIFEQGPQRTLA